MSSPPLQDPATLFPRSAPVPAPAAFPARGKVGGSAARNQLIYLWTEVCGAGGGKAWGAACLALFRANACVIISYRLRRFLLLSLGRRAAVGRLLVAPLLIWCRLVGGRHEFPAEAEIGPGLRIAHPCRPCVVSEWLVAGPDLYLTGGNVIGVRRRIQRGQLVIGEDCMLGIDAKIIGPLKLGDHLRIGAGAVVVHDFAGPATVVGVPAKIVRN